MYNRYSFLKRLNRNYIILIKKNKKYFSYDNDLKILNHLGFKSSLRILDKRKINYIVLEDLEILKQRNFKNNNYRKYLKLTYLCEVLNVIKGNI